MRQVFVELKDDLRFSLRQIRKSPRFALLAAVILGLGIGSASAVFSVLYQVLLKPLAYPAAGELLIIHNALPKSQVAETGVSGFDYAQVRAHGEVFAASGVYYWNDLTLTGFGSARHIDVVNASASFFNTLAVPPKLGRVFTQAEDERNAPKTVVLSEAIWRGTFAADPGIAGRVIHLNAVPYTVVGVMPAAFAFPSQETQMWIPTALPLAESTLQGGRMEKWLHMVARLASGVTVERAQSALDTISDRLALMLPTLYSKKDGWHFTAHPLVEEQTQQIRRWLYLAFGAVFSVLLIACINVSGLLLIRAAARESEVAVRLALGASRGRIVRQILTETAVLVMFGCGLGSVLAVAAVRWINLYGPLGQPTVIHSGTLLFGIALALASTLTAGLLPALWSARLPIDQTLRRAGMRATTADGWWRNAVVAAQLALAVILTFMATSLSRSFVALTRVPVGFDDSQLWSGSVEVPSATFGKDQNWNTQFFEPLLTNLRSIPGVESASGGPLPFNPSGVWTAPLQLPPEKASLHPEAQIGLALPGYFETMKIPLLKGRVFTNADRVGSEKVAVIDNELARRYFANEAPIGKRIASGGSSTTARIVGVVGSVLNSSLDADRKPEVYYPELQERTDAMYFVLRTGKNIDPTSEVRHAIARIDPDVALFDVATMQDRIAGSLSLRRFIALLLNGFALAGMLLAAVGLYSSLAHLVVQRRREIGIRVALGAMQSEVIRLIVSRGVVVMVAGLAIGISGAMLAGQAIRNQLFGVQLTDTPTWIVVLSAVLVVAAVALWVPAKTAAAIDPSITLREQ